MMRVWLLALWVVAGCEPEPDARASAEAAFRAGKYEAAVEGFSQALALAAPEDRAALRSRLGQALALHGRKESAEQTLIQAINEADARGEAEVAAQTRRYLGRLYGDQQRLAEADARYSEAEAWYRDHGPPAEMVKLQIHRAAIAWYSKAFDQAWNLYQDAYFRALTLDDERLRTNSLDGMAMMLAYVGELQEARGLLLQTALLHEAAGRVTDAAGSYATQGVIALAEGNLDEAARLAELALERIAGAGMKSIEIQARIILACVAYERGDTQSALQTAEAAAAQAEAAGLPDLRREAELTVLEALAAARKWSSFAAHADAFQPETAEHRARIETLRARRARAQNDKAALRRHLEAAVAGFDQLRADLGSAHLSSALTRDRREAFEGLIGLLAEAGEVEAALQVIGGVKARAFSERLRAEREVEPKAPPPPAEGSESPLPSRRTVERAGNFFRLAQPQPPEDAALLRAQLPQDVAIIEYYTLPDRLLVFWLSADAIELHTVAAPEAEIDATVDKLLLEIRAKSAEYKKYTAPLGRWLLDPIAARLQTGKAAGLRLLVVVPHGPLHPVPFEALPWAGGLVVDQFAVVTEPNLTGVAAALQASTRERFSAVTAVGDAVGNLPGAREEAAEVARRFVGARTLIGDEARESQVLDLLKGAGRSSLVHFAVHGVRPGPNEPLYLELHPESGFDGRLHADELAALQAPAGLVVLSVCDSGGGRGEAGDEIPWVVDRAFLEAGARSVVASRWPVHDAASVLFMRNFYAALNEGDLIDAFHRAQLALHKGRAKPEELGPLLAVLDNARGFSDPPSTRPRLKDFTHPYFWATFSLRGAWR